LLEKLLKWLSVYLDIWQQGGFSGLREKWESNIPNIGKSITVRDGNMQRSGIIAGFGEDGELLLRDHAGVVHAIWAGDLSG
jgi:biotin-(acetyl-CoA carboxylase) ligase